ncbi:MAG: hypothetical protein EA363_06665 [Balneolaceae bacterium]|nr:MAG: hypothetical protein EA363_06665 [Balneolaceae bacterium]
MSMTIIIMLLCVRDYAQSCTFHVGIFAGKSKKQLQWHIVYTRVFLWDNHRVTKIIMYPVS